MCSHTYMQNKKMDNRCQSTNITSVCMNIDYVIFSLFCSFEFSKLQLISIHLRVLSLVFSVCLF